VATRAYVIIIEQAGESYSAYVPDLPGCIAAADTVEETEQLIREGISIYIDELRAAGQPVPPPTTRAAEVDVPISA
jgi:predicted RNase H-like HicB family nuclease